MKKVYFIDSENVGDNWISLLNTVTDSDQILVFYTEKSPHMNYRNLILLKESSVEVTFIECRVGNNALDFQLSTDLGYRVHDMADSEFIIVSNDTGYDAVVHYWQAKNLPVKRIRGKECDRLAAQTQEKAPTPIAEPQQVQETATNAEEPKEEALQIKDRVEESKEIDSNAREILYLVGRDNLQELHESLKQIYGEKRGKNYYDTFKTDTSYAKYLTQHKKLDTAEKQRAYCSIIFDTAEGNTPMPEDFPKFAVDTWRKKKNLNSFRSSLQGKYGKANSMKYYSIIKAHIKILDQIK